MGLYTKLADAPAEVDIIIAGGGTAGCVVASRLADADPGLSILLIEGGQNNQSPTIRYPACFLAHLAPDSKTNSFYTTNKSAAVADRQLILPTGAVLGGGSSTNMMMYSRAQRSDWDSWNAPGWSANEMLPLLKKLETFHGEDTKETHGHHGPIHISYGTYSSPRMQDEFITSMNKLGWPEVEDLSDLDSINAVWRAKRYISPDGKRQDAASCYLHPRLQDGKHPNLHVLVETQVARILLDKDKRAIGVECRPNPLFAKDDNSDPRSIKATRLVVTSSGACGTPQLLERSGIGDPAVLERAGIPVAVDLPGVGNGYEDHHLQTYAYLNNLDATETLDALAFGRMGSFEDLMKENHKILGWNAQEVQAKVRPTDAEVAALGPEFQQAWDKHYKDYADKPLGVITVIGGFPKDPSLATGDPCLAVSAFTVYPFSRGHIHITSTNLDDAPDFETGFFADGGQIDIKKHIWLYKKQREAVRRMPSYRGEIAMCHPPFAAGSQAAIANLVNGPLDPNVADIEYSHADDVVLEKWLRENVSTTWHSLGTCKMLPEAEMGVVDASLNLHGTQGLKIVDLSIAPRNVAANTNNTALAVGEKGADIIIRELGLA